MNTFQNVKIVIHQINILEYMDDYDEQICKMLKDKEDEMIEFLKKYLSQKEMDRIGDDIIRIMPCRGDVAKIKLDNITRIITNTPN